MQLIMSTDIGIKSMSSINQESLKERETATDLVQEFIKDLTNANKGNLDNHEHIISESKENDSETKLIIESKPKDTEKNSIDLDEQDLEETTVDEKNSETHDNRYNDVKEICGTNSKNDEDKNNENKNDEIVSESDNLSKDTMDTTDSSYIKEIEENDSNIDTDKSNETIAESNKAKCDETYSITNTEENKLEEITKQKIENSTDTEKEIFQPESISGNISATHSFRYDVNETGENISKIEEDANDQIVSESNTNINKDVTDTASIDMTRIDLLSPKIDEDMETRKPNEEYMEISRPKKEESENIEIYNSNENSLTNKLKDKCDLKSCQDVNDTANCEIQNTNSINAQNVNTNLDNPDDSNNEAYAMSLQNVDKSNNEDCDDTPTQSNLTTCKNEEENIAKSAENTSVDLVMADDSTNMSNKVSSPISKDNANIKIENTLEDMDLHEEELKQMELINSRKIKNVSINCMDCDDNARIKIENTHDNHDLSGKKSKLPPLNNSPNTEIKTENTTENRMDCDDELQESTRFICQNMDIKKDTENSNSVDDTILCNDSPKVSEIIKDIDVNKDVEAQIETDETNLILLKKEPKQDPILEDKECNENNVKEARLLENKNRDTYEIPDNEIIDIGDEKSDIDQQDLHLLTTESTSVDNLSSDVTNKIVDVDNNTSIVNDTEINKIVSNKNIEECTETKTNNIELKPQNMPQGSSLMEIDKTVSRSDESNQEAISDTKEKQRKKLSLISKLSNTLDILSDEEDEPPTPESPKEKKLPTPVEKQCINIEDDDDIMVIDDEITSKDTIVNNEETNDKIMPIEDEKDDDLVKKDLQEPVVTVNENLDLVTEIDPLSTAVESEEKKETIQDQKPLLPPTFLKTCKKNLADMTRDELEEFCIIKIVESVVDRSNLGEIKSQLKKMAHDIEEYKRKTSLQLKQNRDLQVVLKSVQEELKKNTGGPVIPLKITRSVGMQVLMTDKGLRKRSSMPNTTIQNNSNNNIANNRQTKSNTQIRKSMPLQIPVPRLVPATNTNNIKNQATTIQVTANNVVKTQRNNNIPNGVKVSSPNIKAEKRSHDKMQQNNSVTVDLTDDEPPAKVVTRNVNPPVRCVPPQNLLAPKQLPSQPLNSPRKVYIPIGGPANQGIRPGQTIMLKSIPSQNATGTTRPRAFAPKLVPNSNTIKMGRVAFKHPAPLPDSMKQYQPPNWKSLPPAPDLKLAKVENGIVISWKIDNYVEENHEEIASYQLFAYQETSSPPSTSLWKKIGDVKALPLPMACTLTQFMAGYKYYFAVRAVDIRSRFGPFSLPGSILLLNKV